ncbi:MAG: hypothetical protein JST75_10760 [Bacteroidetes bacterium]|nr:hypothetical protein [Bacteroidota bacterium]
MKKIAFFVSLFLVAALTGLNAQTVVNTSWKAYYADPINDTIIIHYQKTSSVVTTLKGDTLVISKNVLGKDTIKINDDGGMYTCPSEGVYTYAITGNTLHFKLVSDDCEGRHAIADLAWIKVKEDKKKKTK